MTIIHFVNVGQGNMQVIIFPDNYVIVYDCNITEENEKDVFGYLERIMPKKNIDFFVNSHREADHMSGIKRLNEKYPIKELLDTEVSANTETPEYKEYMEFRRTLGSNVYVAKPYQHFVAKPCVKILNGARDGLNDPNTQSIVLHIDYNGSSVLLTGDTDAQTWKDFIIPEQGDKVKANVLLASHHGSIKFFGNPSNNNHYTGHLDKIKPQFTIISVGEGNPHGHPDSVAVAYYERYTSGSNQGDKIFTTQKHGNIKLELIGNGSWKIDRNQ